MAQRDTNRRRRRRARKQGKQFNKLGRDLGRATDTFNEHLDQGPLTRLDDTRTTEGQNLLNQYQSLSDPASASFAGRRSDDVKRYMSGLRDNLQGFDSQELTGLREQRRREMNRGFQTGRASLARGQSNFRTGSTARAAQLAELAKNYGRSSADAENDLFVQGAEEKRRALDAFGQGTRNVETDENTRGRNALADFRDAFQSDRDDRLGRQKFNLGQEATDRALRSGGILGVLGNIESRRGAKRTNRQIKEQLASNERIAEIYNQAAQSHQSGGGGNDAVADAIAKVRKERED